MWRHASRRILQAARQTRTLKSLIKSGTVAPDLHIAYVRGTSSFKITLGEVIKVEQTVSANLVVLSANVGDACAELDEVNAALGISGGATATAAPPAAPNAPVKKKMKMTLGKKKPQ